MDRANIKPAILKCRYVHSLMFIFKLLWLQSWTIWYLPSIFMPEMYIIHVFMYPPFSHNSLFGAIRTAWYPLLEIKVYSASYNVAIRPGSHVMKGTRMTGNGIMLLAITALKLTSVSRWNQSKLVVIMTNSVLPGKPTFPLVLTKLALHFKHWHT